MKKNVVIAGSTGIVGQEVVASLAKEHNIIEISTKNLDLLDKKKIELFLNKFEKIDFLIFLVGLAHKKGTKKDFTDFSEVNFLTLVNFLNICSKKDILPKKIIFASTISVYGESLNSKVFFEDSNLYPLSPYAITKKTAEEYLLNNFKDNSFILRFAPVYSNNFMLNIFRRIKLKNFFFRVGKGNNLLSLCHIENIILTVRSIINNKIPNGIYNISDLKPYTYKFLLEKYSNKVHLKIPKLAVVVLLLVGILVRNRFLVDNSKKLITDNIYPSDKIRKFIILKNSLDSIKISK